MPDLPDNVAPKVEVTPARETAHGDMATNAALVAAKAARQAAGEASPQALAARLRSAPEVAEASAAGPGFVNIRLRPEALRAMLPVILRAGSAYGDSRIGGGRASTSSTSPPTRPARMHVGHGRGAVVGDALANLLAKAGYAVTKEYYINDAGAQVDGARLGRRLALPAGDRERADGRDIRRRGARRPAIPRRVSGAGRRGDRQRERRALAIDQRHEADGWLDTVRDFTIAAMMAEIARRSRDCSACITSVHPRSARWSTRARSTRRSRSSPRQGLIYQGALEPPKGKTPDDWEPREQTLFRSTQFGDDVDRPLRKSDG